MSSAMYERMRANPKFQELVARRSRFASLRQGQTHPVRVALVPGCAHTSPSFFIQPASALSCSLPAA